MMQYSRLHPFHFLFSPLLFPSHSCPPPLPRPHIAYRSNHFTVSSSFSSSSSHSFLQSLLPYIPTPHVSPITTVSSPYYLHSRSFHFLPRAFCLFPHSPSLFPFSLPPPIPIFTSALPTLSHSPSTLHKHYQPRRNSHRVPARHTNRPLHAVNTPAVPHARFIASQTSIYVFRHDGVMLYMCYLL